MPRNVSAVEPKSKKDQAPASQTRPKLAPTRPAPVDETTPDTYAAIDAARIADEYDAIRIKLAEFEQLEKEKSAQLVDAMKKSGKKNFNTMHGRVTLLEATEGKQVADEKAAVALLEKHGISQPPTMEVWLVQHCLTMPTKIKEGMPDRIKFEMNK